MRTAANMAIFLSGAVLALLATLHVASPEFDPAWRVVSEYADGRYGWMLSLMFACWAVSSWALAFAVRPFLVTRAGRVGLWVLVIAGVGQAIAGAFDINQPLHGLADLLGAAGFPVAAMLVSISLSHSQTSLRDARPLLWLANLACMLTVATIVSVVVLFFTFTHAGGHIPSDNKPLPIGTVLPAGTVAVAGYVNRLYVVVTCLWTMVAARASLSLSGLFCEKIREKEPVSHVCTHTLMLRRAPRLVVRP